MTMKNASVIQGSFYASSDYAMKGCILKGENFFFGIGGMVAEMTKSELAGSNFVFGAMRHRLQQQSNSMIPSRHSGILLIGLLRVSLVATSASFRLPRIQASKALVATPMVVAITAWCGACSSSCFLFRRCLFVRCFCLWLLIACTANSSNYHLFRTKHPPAIPALITFLGLGGIVFYAKLTRVHCKSATRICAVARYPVNCRFCLSAPTSKLG